MSPKSCILLSALLLASVRGSAAEWRSLFDGTYNGWRHWLGFPHESTDLPELQRDSSTKKYLEPLGWDRDPEHVFTIVEIEGRPAMRFSGQVFGVLLTAEKFSNYHLRFQFKWGEKRWPPRESVVRDSGLLYHVNGEQGRSSRTWPMSVEMQIQEHDCGDLWSILSQVTVAARREDGADDRARYIYDPAGEPTVFEQKLPINNRCIKLLDAEKPTGEWNTVDLVVLGDDSIHIVNGQVVMRLRDARQPVDETWEPATLGHIALQSEGAEVFYRDIRIIPITAVPPEFAER